MTQEQDMDYGYGFLLLVRNLFNNYQKKLLDTGIKTGLNAAKKLPHKIFHKTSEETGELIQKNAEKIVKLKHVPDVN